MARVPLTHSASQPQDGDTPAPLPSSLHERVERIIEMIRPAVQADGGDVEFVDITPDRYVRIRLHGACIGCPSAAVTLQLGIERNLREYAPEIVGIRTIEDPPT